MPSSLRAGNAAGIVADALAISRSPARKWVGRRSKRVWTSSTLVTEARSMGAKSCVTLARSAASAQGLRIRNDSHARAFLVIAPGPEA